MKFMIMHKSNAQMEAEQLPSPELIQNVGALVQGAMQDGTFLDAAGLRSSARRARVSFSGGERSLEKGPFTGKNELLAGYALLTVKTMPEAIEWATRLGRAAGNVDVEVGPITEPWDLGVVPKPEGEVPLRVLALLKADAANAATQRQGRAHQGRSRVAHRGRWPVRRVQRTDRRFHVARVPDQGRRCELCAALRRHRGHARGRCARGALIPGTCAASELPKRAARGRTKVDHAQVKR